MSQFQRDFGSEVSPLQAIQSILDDRLRQLHTSIPGVVKSFDPDTKTAEVLPVFADFYDTDDGEGSNEDWTPIPDVPVIYPRGAGWGITWPLEEGDPVLLIFAERSIQEWFASDGKTIVTPQWLSIHAEGDCFCLPGVFPARNNSEIKIDKANLTIHHKDGKIEVVFDKSGKVILKGSNLLVGSETASTKVAKASTTDTNFGLEGGKLDLVLGIFGITPLGPLPATGGDRIFTDD